YLPNIDSLDIEKTDVRDMRLTPYGTITFLTPGRIYEVNYSGAILWKGPGNGVSDPYGHGRYHHEFTRLANGHYIVEGEEMADVILKKANSTDSGLYLFADPGKVEDDTISPHLKILFATILE